MELVIDGTDGAGKTPLVELVVERIGALGRQVATCAPYRVEEVFPLWDREPRRAASIITSIMREVRSARSDRVVVWDRGWPTAWVSTRDPAARDAFLPFPELTVLLLSTPERTREKGQKHGSSAPWMIEDPLIHRFNTAYRALASEAPDAAIVSFEPDPDATFDLDAIADSVLARVGLV